MSDLAVESLATSGLRGVEVWHPQHTPPVVRRYQALAARLGLIATGGSDYHGPGRGADLGDRPVPARVLESLKRAAGVSG
jgi:predicted metal-dependent phosphoesterase TrpH